MLERSNCLSVISNRNSCPTVLLRWSFVSSKCLPMRVSTDLEQCSGSMEISIIIALASPSIRSHDTLKSLREPSDVVPWNNDCSRSSRAPSKRRCSWKGTLSCIAVRLKMHLHWCVPIACRDYMQCATVRRYLSIIASGHVLTWKADFAVAASTALVAHNNLSSNSWRRLRFRLPLDWLQVPPRPELTQDATRTT